MPVGQVTNGVHVPTWDSAEADELWTKNCGQERWRGTMENIQRLGDVNQEQLWKLRQKARHSLIQYARKRLSRQRVQQGGLRQEVAEADSIFNPQALMIGFARRFATYKRPNLLLHDRERLVRILTNRERPVQLILAGKAHPQDQSGQAMIKEWNDFIARSDVRSSVAFLSDYDVLLTSHLVEGVDLWLNTPRRPWEACGTSGMKVLVNGGLNLSELDGWWAEAYSPDVGWAIGDEGEHGDDPNWDAHEAGILYDLLEKEVIPAFYARDVRGVPTTWVTKMCASMVSLTPKFSSNRAVREYVERYYLAAAERYKERSANESRLGIELSHWSMAIAQEWSRVRFGSVATHKEENQYAFEVQVFLGGLDPKAVEVQLYAEPQSDGKVFPQRMTLTKESLDSAGYALYSSKVPANRPATDYTPRVIPCESRASVPLEAAQILWEK